MTSPREFLTSSSAAALAGGSLDLGGERRLGHRLRVVGVGGAGIRALRELKPRADAAADLVAIDTDALELACAPTPHRHQVGLDLDKGWGPRWGPGSWGRAATRADLPLIRRLGVDAETVILVAGLGGATATGAMPVMGDEFREGAATMAVATLPFSWEEQGRHRCAEEGLFDLMFATDLLIPVPNQALESMGPGSGARRAALKRSDHAIAAVVDALRTAALLSQQGRLEPLTWRGQGAVGLGVGASPASAVEGAIASPLLRCPYSAPLPEPSRRPEPLFWIYDRPVEIVVQLRGAGFGEGDERAVRTLVRNGLGVDGITCDFTAIDDRGYSATLLVLPVHNTPPEWDGRA